MKKISILIILLFAFISLEAGATKYGNQEVAVKAVNDLKILIESNRTNVLNGNDHLNQYTIVVNADNLALPLCTDPYMFDNVPSWDNVNYWSDLNAELCAFNTNNVFDISHYGIILWYPKNTKKSDLYDLMSTYSSSSDNENFKTFVQAQGNGSLATEFKPIYQTIQDHINTNFECPEPLDGELMVTMTILQSEINHEGTPYYKTNTKTLAATSQLMTEHFNNYVELTNNGTLPLPALESPYYYYDKLWARLHGYLYYFQNIDNLPEGTSCTDFPAFSETATQNMVNCYCTQYQNMTDKEVQFLFKLATFWDEHSYFIAPGNPFAETSDCQNGPADSWYYNVFPDFMTNHGTDDWQSYLLTKMAATDNYPDIGIALWLAGTSLADQISLTATERINILKKIQEYTPPSQPLPGYYHYQLYILNIATTKNLLYGLFDSVLGKTNQEVIQFKNKLNLNPGLLSWIWENQLDTWLGNESEKKGIVTAITKIGLADFSGPFDEDTFSDAFDDRTFIWKLNPNFGYEEDHHTYSNANYNLTGNQSSFDHFYVKDITTSTQYNPYSTQGSGVMTITTIDSETDTYTLNPFDIVCVVSGEDFKWNTDCWSLLSGDLCKHSAQFMPAYALAWYVAHEEGSTTYEQWTTAVGAATLAIPVGFLVTAASVPAAIAAGFVVAVDLAALTADDFYAYTAYQNDDVDPNEVSQMASQINAISNAVAAGVGLSELGFGIFKGISAIYRLRSFGLNDIAEVNKALVGLGKLADSTSEMAKVLNKLGLNSSSISFINSLDKGAEVKLVLAGWLAQKTDLQNLSPARLNYLVSAIEEATIMREIVKLGHSDMMKFLNDFDDFTAFADPILVKTWKQFDAANLVHTRKNVIALQKFAQFDESLHPHFLKFSDNANPSESTIANFLEDATPDFINGFNNYPNFAPAVVGHKPPLFDPVDFSNLLEELDDIDAIPGAAHANIGKWIGRSSELRTFVNYLAKGNSLNVNIVDDILAQGSLASLIQTKLGVNLSEYTISATEVPLLTTNGFMKADLILAKPGFTDVIIIENKLSQGTQFTVRQKEGFSAIKSATGSHPMTVKYAVDPFSAGMTLNIDKSKCLKISDHTTDDISTISAEDIKDITQFNF